MLNKISTGVALAAVLAAIAAGGCVRNASGERPEVIELESLRPPFPWTAAVRFHPAVLAAAPGATWTVEVDATADLRGYREQYGRFTELILAVQAHRRYDERGFYRSGPVSIALSSNFTTTGLPIERFDGWPTLTALHGKDGSPFEAVKAFPLDGRIATKHKLSAALTVSLPDDTPVGWYEPRIMIFARVEGVPDPVMLENYGDNSNTQDLQLLPLVRVGEPSAPHIPWTVLSEYYYRGQAGTLPDEDKNHVAVTSRSGFVSQLTLKPGSYTAHVALPSVFPLFSLAPIDGGQEVITERNLNYFAFDRGEVHGSIDGPTGRRDLGTRRMAGEGASGPLLEGGGFPVDLSATGDYTIRLAGYLEDRYGRRFEGGGTYRVTAAQPLSFSTSCKPGTSFLVGGAYPAKVNVNPPFPADVRVEVDYYPNSDPARKVTWVGAGKANRFGHFTPHAGPPLKFDEPGEYVSRTEARYVDARGELWLHRQTSGGVVAPRQPEVLRIHGTRSFPYEIRYERDDLGAEARFASRLDMTTPFLPFRPSPLPDPFAPHEKTDTLFIPSGGFNESIVEPHVSMSVNDPALRRRLVDGYRLRSAMPSPLLQPHGKSWEYLEDVVQVSADSAAWFAAKDALELPILPVGDGRWHPFSFPERNRVDAYAYLGVVRPGFPVMTSVLQSEAIGLYWSASPNRFGEQFNTGFNGDLPGDQYRIQAGAVVKDRVTGKNYYDAYGAAIAVEGPDGAVTSILPPGERPLVTSVGRPFYVYLAQDTHDTLEVGEKMGFGGMVFPNIEADVTWEVTKPSGDLVVVNGRSSRLGIVRGQRLIPLDEPGLYRIRGTVHYGEYHGSVPGNYDGTFWHCAVEPNREILIDTDLAATQTIDENGLRIPISWPDDLNDVRVHYGVIMPGRILDQGDVAPRGGSWEYPFYPKNLAAQHPNLDVRNFATGEWELADTLIFQFFLEGTRGDQKMYDSLRLVLRDNRLYNFEKLLAHRGSE